MNCSCDDEEDGWTNQSDSPHGSVTTETRGFHISYIRGRERERDYYSDKWIQRLEDPHQFTGNKGNYLTVPKFVLLNYSFHVNFLSCLNIRFCNIFQPVCVCFVNLKTFILPFNNYI